MTGNTDEVRPRSSGAQKVYTVGTLCYDRRKLITVLSWLVGGDFCVTLFESIFRSFVPLYLAPLHASGTFIAFVNTGIGGILNLLLLPHISMWSDRHRGPWGRRIPFLFWAAPFAAIGLSGMGYAVSLGSWLHHSVGLLHTFSALNVTFTLVVLFAVMYSLCVMSGNNIHNFLLRDVVPQEAMPWYLSLVRMGAVIAQSIFAWILFRYIVESPQILCVSLGIIYFVSYWLICWRVKEGEYPPPPPRPEHGLIVGAMASYFRYFRECMSEGIYRNYIFVFILMTTGMVGTVSFLPLFGTETLGMSAGTYGKILAVSTLVSGVVYLPIGYLCRHFHPIRVVTGTIALMAIVSVGAFFFVHNQTDWLVYSIICALPTAGWMLGSTVVVMMLFPSEKFGQLSSSVWTIGWGSLALTSFLVGRVMDLFDGHYRMIFLIMSCCYALAVVPMVQVYRGWKKHGGPDNYVPPLPE